MDKLKGGFTPKIPGRPKSVISGVPLPGELIINLKRRGFVYSPLVADGQRIRAGEALGEATVNDTQLLLPSPSGGIVSIHKEDETLLRVNIKDPEPAAPSGESYEPQTITEHELKTILTENGLWPGIWSSQTHGIPGPLEKPSAILVQAVFAEPFRARGKVILEKHWGTIMTGISFLPRLLADYGRVEVILTEKNDPVAKMMYSDLAGKVWIRIHVVELRYPIEDFRLLDTLVRSKKSSLAKEDVIWITDIQFLNALGTFMDGGRPLSDRIIAFGGPGCSEPQHLSVRIGTPIREILARYKPEREVMVLRGGLFNGQPVAPDSDAIEPEDDALFLLPVSKKRQFVSFLRPGFRKRSILPCYAANFIGGTDSDITDLLRGERRACIACGLCERVCPVDIYPQIIHRYLYRDDLEKAEKLGVARCIACGLCTYVCPSKIELEHELAAAREKIEALNAR